MDGLDRHDARFLFWIEPVNVGMRLEVFLWNAREKIPQHRKREIARHASNAADDKISVRRPAERYGLGYQSMG
jgi:hypothetical protein